MSLSPWTDVPFDDQDAFADFLLAHGLAHQKIADVIYGTNHPYATYPLFDFTGKKDEDWLNIHQQEHESIFTITGLKGLPDLAASDFTKEDEWYDWHLLHRQVHEQINFALGIV